MALTFRGPDAELRVEVEPRLNVLAHAQLEEWSLGSRCGGHGQCGGDRVRIPLEVQAQAFSAPTAAEQRLLSREELNQGWRLACQVWPNDPAVEVLLDCPGLKKE